jgi:type IV fimbrial biogenesis protein FimT
MQQFKRQFGVTMIELAVTVAIVSILASLAIPSFVNLIADNRQSSQVNSLLADMRFARSESIKRGRSVALCPSASPESVSASCSGSDWKTGWIVFVDENSDNSRANTEPVLRRQEAAVGSSTVVGAGGATVSSFRFNAEGRIPGAQDNLKFVSLVSGVSDRLMCVNTTGRVRVAPKGDSAC